MNTKDRCKSFWIFSEKCWNICLFLLQGGWDIIEGKREIFALFCFCKSLFKQLFFLFYILCIFILSLHYIHHAFCFYYYYYFSFCLLTHLYYKEKTKERKSRLWMREKERENDGGRPLFGFLSSLTLYSDLEMSEQSQNETWPHFTSKAILLLALSAKKITLNQA